MGTRQLGSPAALNRFRFARLETDPQPQSTMPEFVRNENRNSCTLIRRRFLLPKLVSDKVSEPSVEKVELKMLEFELSLSRRPVLATIRIAFDVNAAMLA